MTSRRSFLATAGSALTSTVLATSVSAAGSAQSSAIRRFDYVEPRPSTPTYLYTDPFEEDGPQRKSFDVGSVGQVLTVAPEAGWACAVFPRDAGWIELSTVTRLADSDQPTIPAVASGDPIEVSRQTTVYDDPFARRGLTRTGYYRSGMDGTVVAVAHRSWARIDVDSRYGPDAGWVWLPSGTITPTENRGDGAFSDVPDDHWAAQPIRELTDRGHLSGYDDGTFHPSQSMTRAEFAAVLDSAFVEDASGSGHEFVDVDPNCWAFDQIRRVADAGWLSGEETRDGTYAFRPNETVSRLEVLAALDSGLELTPHGSEPPTDATRYLGARGWRDVDTIEWGRPAVARMAYAHVTATDTYLSTYRELRPEADATRAHVANFVYRAIQSPTVTVATPNGLLSETADH